MKTKLMNIINDYKERYTLKKAYPETEAFVFLSELFPNLYVRGTTTGDKIVPVIKSKGGKGYKKICEVKDVNEVLTTEVIPVAYHSAYSRGVAQGVIRDAFEQYPDFFKEFLGKYTRIVLDDEVKEDGALVIDSYARDLGTDGYTLINLMETALDGYGLSKADIEDIAARMDEYNRGIILNDASIFTRLFTERKISADRLRSFYARNGKFAELKKLLEHKEDTAGVASEFLETEAVSFLNAVLDRGFFPSLVSNNSKVTRDAIKHFKETVKIDSNRLGEMSSIEMDRIETINTTRTLIKNIDVTGNLSKYFEEILKAGKLLTFRNDSKTGLPFEFFKTDEQGKIEVCNDRSMNDANTFLTVDFTDSMTDVFELVDRIVLTYIDTHKSLGEDEVGLDNMFVSYYETKVRDWLVNVGNYDEKEVNRLLNIRRKKATKGKSLDAVEVVADAMVKKATNKVLSLDNISDSEDEAVQKQEAFKVADTVMVSRGKLDTEATSFVIGSYFGDKYPSDDFSRYMMYAMNAYEYGTYEAADVLTKLMRSVSNEGGISIHPAALWRSDFHEFPNANTAVKSADWSGTKTNEAIQLAKKK